MTKMTEAQLVDENIALRHNLSLLEAKVADLANQLVAAKGAANTKVGDLIKRKPQPQPGDEVVVATYTKRDGTVWNKVRTGWNTYTHRPAQAFHVVAGKYDGNEENCKFADVRYTLEEAEALLLTVRDYPWARIEAA